MRLLIITQKMDRNDPILGFFHRWVEEFAKHTEKLTVICLEKGECDLPKNVQVYSLGKEEGVSRLEYIYRFYKYIFKFRNDYDSVFVHMNQVYVILGGIFWRIMGKRISLWYTHKSVTTSLRIAEKLVHVIFSASGASFKIKTNKLHVMGHGIDVGSLACDHREPLKERLKILVVGRISEIKGAKYIVEACRILKEKGILFEVSFIGDPITKPDYIYLDQTKELINKYSLEDEISFDGSFPNHKIKEKYCRADITINPLPTGGVDKVVIEAMACGVVPFTSDEAFVEYFGEYSDLLHFKFGDSTELANKIINFMKQDNVNDIRQFLINTTKAKFNVSILIKNIVDILSYKK